MKGSLVRLIFLLSTGGAIWQITQQFRVQLHQGATAESIQSNHRENRRNDPPLPLLNDGKADEKVKRPALYGVPYSNELEEHGLLLSMRQQERFFARKNSLERDHGSSPLMFSTATWKYWNRWHALILNDRFAFRHIFKTGGTSLEKQTGSKHVQRKAIGNRRMIATVRDPLEHFLSGWQECGERFPEYMEWNYQSTGKGTNDEKSYSRRIQQWLDRTKTMAFRTAPCLGKCACAMHSFPQASFLITKKGTVDPKVDLVGDLRELPGLLEIVGFQYNESLGTGRNASATEFKTTYFPRKPHLIVNDTMKAICEFVALDYYLFDFALPIACRK
ncbi:unnamed protein product [Cylindrotheca closterium]|uniref:Carbohydrate sulfotransferase n=1 Tax=Cylindrotheca closterium TaxID=2856 RepID=A0AAD2FUA8_9STRA|nr:unnamed protein product [Cylindrotheca closterium]